MATLEQIYESMLCEQRDASDDQYWGALKTVRPDMVDISAAGEQMVKWAGVKINNRQTDSGGLIVRWGQQDDMIFILGIVSPTGKLTRQDHTELAQWVDELVRHILDGKTIATSTNGKSGPLIKRVISKVEQLGGKVDITNMGSIDIGGEKYVSVMISLQ